MTSNPADQSSSAPWKGDEFEEWKGGGPTSLLDSSPLTSLNADQDDLLRVPGIAAKPHMLLGDDLEFVGNGKSATSLLTHDLEVRTFTKPTDCSVCGKLLLGLRKQGLACKKCGAAAHKKCAELLDVEKPCESQGEFEHEWMLGPPIHEFALKTFTSPTKCKLCHEFLLGIFQQGLECRICKAVVHKKCANQYSSTVKGCKPPAPEETSPRRALINVQTIPASDAKPDNKVLSHSEHEPQHQFHEAPKLQSQSKPLQQRPPPPPLSRPPPPPHSPPPPSPRSSPSSPFRTAAATSSSPSCTTSTSRPPAPKRVPPPPPPRAFDNVTVANNNPTPAFTLDTLEQRLGSSATQLRERMNRLDADWSETSTRLATQLAALDNKIEDSMNDANLKLQRRMEYIEQNGIANTLALGIREQTKRAVAAIDSLSSRDLFKDSEEKTVHKPLNVDPDALGAMEYAASAAQTLGAAGTKTVNFVKDSTVAGLQYVSKSELARAFEEESDPRLRRALADGFAGLSMVTNQVSQSISDVGAASGRSIVSNTTRTYGPEAGRMAQASTQIIGGAYDTVTACTGFVSGSHFLKAPLRTADRWALREPVVLDGNMYQIVYNYLGYKGDGFGWNHSGTLQF